jgi:alkylhydroperoxidase family enzyme
MTWLRTFRPDEASGKLAEAYREVMEGSDVPGRVPEIMKCMGLRPDALLAVLRLNRTITFGASTLGRRREEMLATAVSAVNGCHY